VREDALQTGLQSLVAHTCLQFRRAQVFLEIFKQNLDEDTACRRRFLFVEVDNGQDVPANGVRGEEMTEEPSNVP
jgi:hypothetical protein